MQYVAEGRESPQAKAETGRPNSVTGDPRYNFNRSTIDLPPNERVRENDGDPIGDQQAPK